MKKLLCIAFASALLSTGYAQAADLPLADGHVLPLPQNISVHQGKDSYFAKDIQKVFASKDLETKMIEATKKNDAFKALSDSDKILLAKEMYRLVQDIQFSQIVSDTGDHVYQAFVISCPMTKDSFQNWEKLSHYFPQEQKTPLPSSKMTWEAYQALATSHGTREGTIENSIISLSDGLGSVLLHQAQWKESQSKQGIPYLQYAIYSTQQQGDMLQPLYLSVLATPSKDQVGFTLFFTTQTDGAYFDSYIAKALEALK